MKKVSFCGISGSGMSALAQVLAAKGFEVSGSDRSFDQGKDLKQKKALEKLGIKIFPQDGSAVDSSTECLYISTAVEESIPDVKKAMDLGIRIQKRSDLLAEIFNAADKRIAVAGTSGKTTLTAMIGYILDTLGQKPTVINGGYLKNYASEDTLSNVILNKDGLIVVEADESDGSIEKYLPDIAVVNNVSIDHKSLDELKKLFSDFVQKSKIGAIINLDCQNSASLLGKAPQTLTFSIRNPEADIYLHQIRPLKNGVEYVFENQKYRLNLIGAFNVANAAAAVASCKMLGLDPFQCAKALEGFLGTSRRLDIIGCRNQITVIDDFAHNPDKVSASVSALRDYDGRLLVMFQPHGFAPMRLMGREIMQSFANTLLPTDYLFIPEIFYSGGTVTKDISSKDLVEYAQNLNVQAEFYQTKDEIQKRLITLAKPGDRIVIMGARDNSLTDFCKTILEEISA